MEFKTTKQLAKHHNMELNSEPKKRFKTGKHTLISEDIKISIEHGFEDGGVLVFFNLDGEIFNKQYISLRTSLHFINEELESFEYNKIEKKVLSEEEFNNLNVEEVTRDFLNKDKALTTDGKVEIELNCRAVFEKEEIEELCEDFYSNSGVIYLETLLSSLSKKYMVDCASDFYQRYLDLTFYCVADFQKKNFIELTDEQDDKLTYHIIYDYMINKYLPLIIYKNKDYVIRIMKHFILDKTIF